MDLPKTGWGSCPKRHRWSELKHVINRLFGVDELANVDAEIHYYKTIQHISTPELDAKRDAIILRRLLQCLDDVEDRIDVMCAAAIVGVHYVSLKHVAYDQYLENHRMIRESYLPGWEIVGRSGRVYIAKIQ